MFTTTGRIAEFADLCPIIFSPLGRLVTRAWMVVFLARGWSASEVASAFSCHPKTVRRWSQRYRAEGPEGPADRSRPGRTRKVPVEVEVDQLLAKSLPEAGADFTFWTVARLTVGGQKYCPIVPEKVVGGYAI